MNTGQANSLSQPLKSPMKSHHTMQELVQYELQLVSNTYKMVCM